MLANSAQVIAFFLPEAPLEMLQIFDEVFSLCVCVYVHVFVCESIGSMYFHRLLKHYSCMSVYVHVY